MVKIQSEFIRFNPNLPVKWTEGFNMHVTVEFLGEIDEARVEKIKEILRALATRRAVFEYRLGGLRAFPDWRAPRVLAVDLEEVKNTPSYSPPQRGGDNISPPLRGGARGGVDTSSIHLPNALRQELRRAGFIVDSRPWTPHLTLGRIKSAGGNMQKEGIQIPTVSWQVDKIEFIKSELTPQGSRYTVLETFALLPPEADRPLAENY